MKRTARLAAGLAGSAFGRALLRPEDLLARADARFVKDHRRTAVAAVSVEGREIYVKRFKQYAWYKRVEAAVTRGPARRCWENAQLLEQAGLFVAPALACVEVFAGSVPGDAYFVTEAVAGAAPAGRFWTEQGAALGTSGRRALLAAGARHLRRVHESGFYTRDANADNFLVRAAGASIDFFLLDLENVRRPGAVSERRRRKNLVQLLRPIRGAVRRIDQVRFVRAYLGAAEEVAGHGEVARWLRALAAADRRKEAEYRRRARSGRSA